MRSRALVVAAVVERDHGLAIRIRAGPRCPERLPIISLLKRLHEELYEGERTRRSR